MQYPRGKQPCGISMVFCFSSVNICGLIHYIITFKLKDFQSTMLHFFQIGQRCKCSCHPAHDHWIHFFMLYLYFSYYIIHELY